MTWLRLSVWFCLLTACTRHEGSEAEANRFLASRRAQYETACTNGETSSCEVLGDFYHFGVAGTPVDEAKSKAFYHRACAGGSTTACKKERDPDWLAKEVRGTTRTAADAR
jgi:hypothetical protein